MNQRVLCVAVAALMMNSVFVHGMEETNSSPAASVGESEYDDQVDEWLWKLGLLAFVISIMTDPANP